jgi:2-methylaconitate cis-trans-isomerase PrpF
VTGALAVATAAVLPGTVASRFVEPRDFSGGVLAIEHPSGRIEVDLVTDHSGSAPVVERASFVRTARRIFDGYVHVPEALFR